MKAPVSGLNGTGKTGVALNSEGLVGHTCEFTLKFGSNILKEIIISFLLLNKAAGNVGLILNISVPFPIVLVLNFFKDLKVMLIPHRADNAGFDSSLYSAAGFIAMGTIGKTALV